MHCCVSTATVVTRTRHSVTLHAHCLSCFIVHNCAVVTMEKVVLNIIYRKDTVSAINCTHYWIYHILGRCKLRCTVSRADKITEACFTSSVYIGRESNAKYAMYLGGKHYPAVSCMLFA
jgi:hypothetical protein